MSEQHKRFLSRLAKSSDAVFAVARWLHDRGHSVEIPAIKFAPTAAEAEQFLDGGDIIVDPENSSRRIVQVKQISRNFTGLDDWPFKEVLVSNVAAVDRLDGKVAAYFTVSKDKTSAAIVMADTRGDWYTTEKLASNTGNVESFYACPLRKTKFVQLLATVQSLAA